MKLSPRWSAAVLCAAIVATSPSDTRAQDATSWNTDRVLRLIDRAQALRQAAVVDSAFQSYRAEARGYVYFLFDRPDTDGRNLVKADQIALEVFWQAPASTKQRIVGQRDRKLLPTDIRYHLDHVTVVQDDFGDFIRMGDGDEVEAVLHPVAPGAAETYDFELADSLTLSYAGGAEEIRVYEVRVRPRDLDRPGFVGTVYLDRATAAIVRMSFSFTAASYVDPYLDYIRISLDNSLWMGRHWLPYRQEVEIRREIPFFDLMAGSVIHARFDVRGYDFNVDLPAALFRGGRVSAASPAQRRAFAFERGLFDDLDEEGLEPTPSMEAVQTEVRDIVQDRALSGLAPLRFHAGGLSEAARYNRAEGLRLGAGFTARPEGDLIVRTSGGYAFGRRRLSGGISASRGPGPVQPTLELYWERLGDIGGYPGSETLLNTISAVTGDEDFTDPFFRSGVTLTLSGRGPGGPSVAFRWEENQGARDVVSDASGDRAFRPVRSVDEGELGAVIVRAPVAIPGNGEARFIGEVGRLGSRNFGALRGEASWLLDPREQPWQVGVSLGAGGVTREAPAQSLYLLGGRHTLPGHDYRSFTGDRFWLLRGEGTLDVRPPYLGVRLIGAVGSTYLGDRRLPADWVARDSGGLRGSVGAGLSFGWDTVRLDLAHGVRGGGWEAFVSVAQRFRAWL